MSDSQPSSSLWLTWCTALLTAAAIGFVCLNIYLHRTNLALQEELANRQHFINESIRLSRFNTELIQALATLAAQTDDQPIRALLSNHGISFSVNPPTISNASDSASGVDNE